MQIKSNSLFSAERKSITITIVVSDRRRSNVVKEVERLKKNREERRAKQQEMLEEKEKAVEMNANHANYDFFCMIQDYQEQLEFNPVSEDDAWASDHQVMEPGSFS